MDEFEQIIGKIEQDIKENNVILYMKGTSDFPQCGFSNVVSSILKKLNVKFKCVNVLEDDVVREAIKKYSDWPTIPQLYIKQEFIGGCDIVKEMYLNGELRALLQKEGIVS
ncbi:monothiol glutaredoxin, Grx4 family [Wolbachia pipientis]|uniref:Glutaredoxin n=1 Tax=Wolbachia pipientis TaxID=955 RepID=A0A1E7QKZ3_WOLPI|nr:Grx4 family monothiol glutaredoxin [Wolbachia pipientis]OEY86879.1 monothiol glutaredoxin, Grx4 family [Wolbachia pipientis]